ncbi:helix-turn-helix domain-containing protein [Chitinophaga japonensis]|uniref:Helix-turn-helix protein n=1 Tax=Chitinophaga japonensis TaxID=104662 RepID=A0A562T398_CHIJA|nr:helix-turn-helix transcriptional regulator [Chitinophaga japonensis]TWI87873.1 helix-turn-helix protein [Chitinophaga japonensis]
MADTYKKALIAFGKNVRQLRADKKLSQRELAALCNIDHADISRIENAEMNIKFSSIVQLAEALEVEIEYLFKFDH